MLFVVHLIDATPLVVDAADEEAALARVPDLAPECVAFGVTAIPPGTFACELRAADPEGDEDPANPANVSDVGIALEPFEDCAGFLAACDLLEPPSAAEVQGG